MDGVTNRTNEVVPLLPCAKCGHDSPLGSLVVDGPRNRMVITGTVYTCMGDDCDMQGAPCQQGDEGARENWNAAQRRHLTALDGVTK